MILLRVYSVVGPCMCMVYSIRVKTIIFPHVDFDVQGERDFRRFINWVMSLF